MPGPADRAPCTPAPFPGVAGSVFQIRAESSEREPRKSSPPGDRILAQPPVEVRPVGWAHPAGNPVLSVAQVLSGTEAEARVGSGYSR